MVYVEGATEFVGAPTGADRPTVPIRTPDQRLRVFVSSTLGELAEERNAVRGAIANLRLAPVLFELGARPYPPRELYRAYLEQSHIFVGIYWQSYGWVAPGMEISGLEDEYRLAGDRPKLIYVKMPADAIDERLEALLEQIRTDDQASYKMFSTPEELRELVENDLAVLLTERFERSEAGAAAGDPSTQPLPVPATTLVGREREIDELVELLQRDDVRLVTLVGPGGIGKSRLALAVAERLRDRYPDGAVFVPLAPVREPDFLPGALVRALGLNVNAGVPLIETIKGCLRSRRTLLVLDNFEQILDAAPLVAELLSDAPGLEVIVTSRAVLKISSEHEYVVLPLPLPRTADLRSLEALAANDAVRLFVARARAVKPDFELDESNRDAVIAICYRLEGLPLAIELAAARVKFLPPAALLKRLDKRLDVLTGGARDLPDRQKTLRATLDWSFALLSRDERQVFTRLSLFVGGFRLDAAEAIAKDLAVDVVEILFSLADKSLLRHQFEADEPRFWMLEIVREYAREKLEELEDVAVPARNHRDHYLAFTRQADVGLLGHEQKRWLELVEREQANVRAMLRRALTHRELAPVVEAGWNLWRYWWIRGQHAEGRRWMEGALEHVEELAPDLQVRAYFVGAAMAIAQGDLATASPWVQTCIQLAREIDNRFVEGVGHLGAGLIALYTQDLPAVEQHLHRALEIFREDDDWWGRAHVLHYLWRYDAVLGRAVEEIGELRESVDLFRANGDESGLVLVLHDLAMTTLLSGDVPEALSLLDEGFNDSLELRNRWYLAYCFEALGCVTIVLGDLVAGARYFGLADRLRDEVQTPRAPFDMILYAPYLETLERQLPSAELQAHREAGRAWAVDEALANKPIGTAGHGKAA